MFGAIAGGIASALAGGAMSKLFGGGQKAASGGIQGDVLATDNNTVGMGDAGIKSAIQRSEERRVGKECRFWRTVYQLKSKGANQSALLDNFNGTGQFIRQQRSNGDNNLFGNNGQSNLFCQAEDGIRDRSRHSC